MLLAILFTTLLSVKSIPTPDGYKRVSTDGFGTYLRNLKLKNDKTVYLYNHEKKLNQDAQFAVIDMSVGDMDLQQCADAVIRLRAEYLFQSGKFSKIKFTNVQGTVLQFKPPYDHGHLTLFLEYVFRFCNSYSLNKEVKKKTYGI